MMKNLRKVLSMLLAVVMVIAVCCSVTAFAEEETKKNTIVFSDIMKKANSGGVEEEEGDIDVPFYPTVTLKRITVTTLPTKLTYEKGEALDMTGAVVTAYYSDSSSKSITSYTVSGYDANVVGEQTITVSFDKKTTTFTVTVTDPAAAVLVGDVDGNGVVDGMDATLLLQYAAGWNVEIDEVAGDADGNGVVDGMDATLLLQYAAGWNVTLGASAAN